MQILGVDYGRKRIGLAWSDGPLASPLEVLEVKDMDQAMGEMALVMRDKEIDLVVIGVSEREMAKESEGFGKRIKDELNVPVKYQDETLTTQDANKLAIEAGIGQGKRKRLGDAYAATLILQAYLDSQKEE
jgi:putative Holliday junction resolvase